jgi:hypothetical protein
VVASVTTTLSLLRSEKIEPVRNDRCSDVENQVSLMLPPQYLEMFARAYTTSSREVESDQEVLSLIERQDSNIETQ